MFNHVAFISTSFRFIANNIPLCTYSTFYLLSVKGHLCYFQFLVIMNNDIMKISVKENFLEIYAFISFRYIPKGESVGSHGNSTFNFL